MIDTLTFAIALVVAVSVLASLSALVVMVFVFPHKDETNMLRAPVMNNMVASANSALDIAMAVPTAMLNHAFANIATMILLALCVALHVAMAGDEATFLQNAGPTYREVNALWTNGFIDPLVGFATVMYGGVAGAVNFAFIVGRDFVYGTLATLSLNAQTPFVVVKALLAPPMAVGKLIGAVFQVFDTSQGGNWMTNPFDVLPAVRTIQVDLVQAIASQSKYMCAVLAPTFAIAKDILTSTYLANVIQATVGTVWRAIQLPIRLAAPQYHIFDPKPLFTELRALGYYGGAVIDDLVQALLNFGAMQLASSERVALPRPSLGTGIGRTLSAAVSFLELPVRITMAALAGESLYDAADATQVANQARLAVTHLAVGANHIHKLVRTGRTGNAKQLKCNYYGYNFFVDPNILGSIPETCVCKEGQCGLGTCNNVGTCDCAPGYHHVIPPFDTNKGSAAKCVKSCTVAGQDFIRDYLRDHQGNNPPINELYTAQCGTQGECDTRTGYCTCFDGFFIDLRTGKCASQVPDAFRIDAKVQTPTTDWADKRCMGLLTHEVGPPVECAVQSAALAVVGALYTQWGLLREIIFRFPEKHDFPRLLQTFNGMSYPRMDSVNCEYRRDRTAHYDMTIHPDNCKCELPSTAEADNYNPWCAQPTLNADVYSHMDAFAFYAGMKIPVKGLSNINFVFVGGTGAQFGFLADTLGVWTTTRAREAVEFWRIVTKTLTGAYTYALSIGKYFAASERNLLQIPENCDWGYMFDGPVIHSFNRTNLATYWSATMAQLQALDCACNGQTPRCTKFICDRIQSIGTVNTLSSYTQTAALQLIVAAHETIVIKNRNDPFIDRPCLDKSYQNGAQLCKRTNDDSSCACNVELELSDTDPCQCVAFYPRKQAIAQDMGAFFKSDFMAKFYSQKAPWCNSMIFEFQYFYKLSTSVAIQNIFARLDSSNPVSSTIDSPCYKEDSSYTIGTTTMLTRLFQPNPSGSNHIFVGDQGGSTQNTSICNILKGQQEIRWIKDVHDGVEFAGRGSCLGIFDAANSSHRCIEGPHHLRQLALTGFENPYGPGDPLCFYENPELSPLERLDPPSHYVSDAQIKAMIAQHYQDNQVDFCKDMLQNGPPGDKLQFNPSYPLNPDAPTRTFYYDRHRWIDVVAYRAKLQPEFRIATGVTTLHPQTCGFLTQNDNLVFQPCRRNCYTDGGINTCWCNATVHHDILCNVGNLQKQTLWYFVNWERQASTRLVSLLGFITGGLIVDETVRICDLQRAKATAAGLFASAITGQATGAVAVEIRVRIARILFNIAELSSLPFLAIIAQETLIVQMIEDMFTLDDGKACYGGQMACKSCSQESDCNPPATDVDYWDMNSPELTLEEADAQRFASMAKNTPHTGFFNADLTCYPFGQCPSNCTKWPWGSPKRSFSGPGYKCYKPYALCQDKYNCIRNQCIDRRIHCNPVIKGLGMRVANKVFLPYKFGAVMLCTFLDALQTLAYGSSLDLAGADLIPAIQDTINTVMELLDRTFGSLITLSTQCLAGFFAVIMKPGDLVRWGQFVKNFFELSLQVITVITKHRFQVISMMFSLVPEPLSAVAQSVLGGMCIALNYGVGTLVEAVSQIPGVGMVMGTNTFLNPSPIDQCLSDKNTVFGRVKSKLVEKDYKRRRLDSVNTNETEFHYWKTHANWTGSTMCARIGTQQPQSAYEYETWKQCVLNRHRVDVMHTLMGVDYLPWTLLDDWWEPVTFIMRLVHGVAILLTAGEAHLRNWEQLGYPVQASIDLVRHVETWTWQGSFYDLFHEIVKIRSPHYRHDTDSVGHHIMAITHAWKEAKFPDLHSKDWNAAHTQLKNGVALLSNHIVLPSVRTKPQPSRPQQRRLQDFAPQEEAPAIIQDDDTCAGNKVCIDCALLDNVVNSIVDTAEATAEYYTEIYPKLVQDFIDTVAHWESTNPNSPYAIFPNVSVAYRPKPVLLPQPIPNMTLQAAKAIDENIDLVQVAKDFFTVTDDRDLPVTGHSVWYYLQYLLRPCDPLRMGYGACKMPKYSIKDACALTLRTMMAVWSVGWITGLQLPFVIQLPLAAFVLMAYRYDYVPRCLPVLPICLMQDVQHAITQATPACLCQLVPALVVNSDMCTPDYCADSTIVYRNCPERELGIVWPIVFTLRWQVPLLFDILFTHPYSPLVSVPTQDMQQDLQAGVPVSDLDATCATLQMLDILLVVICLKLIAVALSPAVRASTQAVLTSAGSVAITVPYLLVDVPKMMKDDHIMLKGW